MQQGTSTGWNRTSLGPFPGWLSYLNAGIPITFCPLAYLSACPKIKKIRVGLPPLSDITAGREEIHSDPCVGDCRI